MNLKKYTYFDILLCVCVIYFIIEFVFLSRTPHLKGATRNANAFYYKYLDWGVKKENSQSQQKCLEFCKKPIFKYRILPRSLPLLFPFSFRSFRSSFRSLRHPKPSHCYHSRHHQCLGCFAVVPQFDF